MFLKIKSYFKETFMKKLSIVFAIFAAFIIAGCAGGGGGGGDTAAPYIVDLSLLPLVRNVKPFSQPWEDHFIAIPPLPNFDYTKYSRVTITTKYYDAGGKELPPADEMCIVSLINDVNGDWRGPAMGPGPNTPLKEFNVGGYSGTVNTDKGTRIRLTQQPGGILFQINPGAPQAYTELTGLIFHNGNYGEN
jgi:hypothetical protein